MILNIYYHHHLHIILNSIENSREQFRSNRSLTFNQIIHCVPIIVAYLHYKVYKIFMCVVKKLARWIVFSVVKNLKGYACTVYG